MSQGHDCPTLVVHTSIVADPAETPQSEVPEPEIAVKKRLSAKAGCAMISVGTVLVFSVIPYFLRYGIDAVSAFESVVWLAVYALLSLPLGHLIDKNRD